MKPVIFSTIFICSCLLALVITTAAYGAGLPDTAVNNPAAQGSQMQLSTLSGLNKQYTSIEKGMTKSTEQMLKRMERQEQRLRKKMMSVDSSKAKELFGTSTQFYVRMQQKLTGATNKTTSLNQFVPGLDSLQTAMKYLQQTGTSISGLSTAKLSQINQLSGTLNSVENKLQTTADIGRLLSERKQQLQQTFSQLGISKQLQNYNKEVYYYKAQLNEYKTMLHDEKKLETKALSVVRELPAFKDFLSKNSILAQLFPMGASSGSSSNALSLVGLQGRPAVLQQLQLSGVGSVSNPQQSLQQQVDAAQSQIDQLKNKVNQLGGSSSTIEMPDFSPNTQHTKTFLQRIEYGLSVQSQRSNGFLPVTTDIAITAGYKLGDKSTVGLGGGYKVGWGSGLNHITISEQGMSVRSFIDIKLKGTIWITGGYEQNYFPDVKTKLDSAGIKAGGWGAGWQPSGLIGLSKKYKIGKKGGNLQLLWDFLSYQQIPRAAELKFRLGYTL